LLIVAFSPAPLQRVFKIFVLILQCAFVEVFAFALRLCRRFRSFSFAFAFASLSPCSLSPCAFVDDLEVLSFAFAFA
jgi:hypothetical protein